MYNTFKYKNVVIAKQMANITAFLKVIFASTITSQKWLKTKIIYFIRGAYANCQSKIDCNL